MYIVTYNLVFLILKQQEKKGNTQSENWTYMLELSVTNLVFIF